MPSSLFKKWSAVKSLSRVRLFTTPWTVAYQAPLSMGFSRQEYWSGVPFPSPEIFPTQGSNPRLPCCRQALLPSEPPGKLQHLRMLQTCRICFRHLLSEWMSLRGRLFLIGVTANGDHTHRRTRGVSNDDGLSLFIWNWWIRVLPDGCVTTISCLSFWVTIVLCFYTTYFLDIFPSYCLWGNKCWLWDIGILQWITPAIKGIMCHFYNQNIYMTFFQNTMS